MGWGDSVSAEMGAAERGKFPGLADGSTLGKIGSRKSGGIEKALIKKPAVVLDMGEASREQGFRLNGCR